MSHIYSIISQSRTEIICLIGIIFIALILFYKNLQKKKYKPQYNDTMPANLWFYTQLINIEIGEKKANQKTLKKIFIEFLYRKYRISKYDLSKKTIFVIVREKEDNDTIINLYGDIWNSIDDLKQKSNDEVIKYVKSIKLKFNKDGFDDWIKSQKIEKNCNNC